jgi:hypothetical protein
MAKTDEKSVARKETDKVRPMLWLTFESAMVSKRCGAFSERNIPAIGAIMKRRAAPPVKSSSSLDALRFFKSPIKAKIDIFYIFVFHHEIITLCNALTS